MHAQFLRSKFLQLARVDPFKESARFLAAKIRFGSFSNNHSRAFERVFRSLFASQNFQSFTRREKRLPSHFAPDCRRETTAGRHCALHHFCYWLSSSPKSPISAWFSGVASNRAVLSNEPSGTHLFDYRISTLRSTVVVGPVNTTGIDSDHKMNFFRVNFKESSENIINMHCAPFSLAEPFSFSRGSWNTNVLLCYMHSRKWHHGPLEMKDDVVRDGNISVVPNGCHARFIFRPIYVTRVHACGPIVRELIGPTADAVGIVRGTANPRLKYW